METSRRFNTSRVRRAGAVVAMLAILGLVLALAPVSLLADQLFNTFRVQQFQAITVRVPNMKDMPAPRQLTQAEQDQIAALLKPLGTPKTDATKDTAREVPDRAAAGNFLNQKGGKFHAPKSLPAMALNALPAIPAPR